MILKEVVSSNTIKEFHKVPHIIYQSDPNWICPLHAMVEQIFDPTENIAFRSGNAMRWVLKNNKGDLIGRIAAFYIDQKKDRSGCVSGGCGFFECIDNQQAANKLFDTAKSWLMENGMEAMDGPINFGENDNFWGLLVEGFTPPGFGMAFHPKYYKNLFETYGFKLFYEQVSNHLNLTKPLPEKYIKVASYIVEKGKYNFVPFRFKQIDKFLKDFKEIHEDAWQFHENYKPVDINDVKSKFMSMKAFAIEEFVWFAYHNNEPVGVLIMMPDVNQLFKHINGKLNLWNKLKLLRLKKKRVINRARLIAMGVKQKYQRTGIDAGFFYQLEKVMKEHPEYKEIELSWVGEFNPKMRALMIALGSEFGKRHYTYRYLFDRSKEVIPLNEIPINTKESVM